MDREGERPQVQSKSKSRAVSKFIVLVIVVYLATYASLYGLRFVMATDYPIVVVEGVSMQPTYYEGDLLLLRGIPEIDISISDVVVYRRSYSSMLIVHRVVGIRSNGGELYFITQGDNRVTNPLPDSPVLAENVIGVVAFHVPKLGGVVLALQSPMGLVFSGALIVVILILDVLGEGKGKSKQNNPS